MKQKLQRLLRPTGIVLGALGIAGLLAFSARSTNTTPVKELAVEVDAPEGVHFIDENAVREQVLHATDAVIGAPIGDVDLVAIEDGLRHIGCVAKANVYHTMDGTLHVKVKQREPIVRVINADGSSYYIDREGWTMPLSENYTARVLVVTGVLFEPFAQLPPMDLFHIGDSLRHLSRSDEIFLLASTVAADPVWNALFDNATVDALGEFELIPRIGGQRVKVGRLMGTSVDARVNADGMRELLTARLNKLRAFYQQGMPQSDWRMYGTIDTRFADQVVCTRRADYRPAPVPKKPATAQNTVRARDPAPQPAPQPAH
jgi:cell division protein FtsQ